jgi:Fe-S-cluster containining protein
MRGKRPWRDHPARDELQKLYAEVEVLVAGCSCTCANATGPDDARCCQFGVTGREPYPTPVELCEVDLAMRALGGRRTSSPRPTTRRSTLPLVRDHGACPLLGDDGRCSIYASRPFGCRTFFCAGHEPSRKNRDAIQSIGRRIGDLAARVFPRAPLPRPFTRALAGTLPSPDD